MKEFTCWQGFCKKFRYSILLTLASVIILQTGCGNSEKPPVKPTDNKPNTTTSRIIKQSTNVIDTINTGVKGELLCIHRLNAGRSLATGKNGLIITSSNGGLNWLQRAVNDTMDYHAAYMLNAHTYIVAGEGGRILRTTDFGQTWTVITSPVSNIIGSLTFSDTLNGYAAYGSTSVLKTSDGGSNWVIKTTSSAFNLNGISASTPTDIKACGESGTISASTDGGTVWLPQSSGVTANLYSIDMLNQQYGRIAGDSGKVLLTSNGGTNWITENSHTFFNLRSITISNINLSFAGGSNVALRKQNADWNRLGLNVNIPSISVGPDYNIALAAGGNSVYIISEESCPCTHILDLTYETDQNGVLWALKVTPDINQNVRAIIRLEVGGTVDHSVSGWTQYTDNITGNTSTDNSTIPVVYGSEITYDFFEVNIEDIDNNDQRTLNFRISAILNPLNPTYNVPLYVNFLNTERTSCLTKCYILDCTP